MSLIGRLINQLLTKGSITLKEPGKPPRTYGAGGGKHLTVRFTDRKVALDVARNPRPALRRSLYGRAGSWSRMGRSSTCWS